LEFDKTAFEDLAWWIEQDRDKALRIIKLIREVQRDPFRGIGKPEPLRHELASCWSRRIDHEHRLVYQVMPEKIRILACRYHYGFFEIALRVDTVIPILEG
jgi:toxin YoeB